MKLQKCTTAWSRPTGAAITIQNSSHHALGEPVQEPRKLMLALAPCLEDAFVRPLPSNPGILRLLLNYADVLEDDNMKRTPELQHAVATHIHDLCALAIGTTRDAAEVAEGRGLRAARLRTIKALGYSERNRTRCPVPECGGISQADPAFRERLWATPHGQSAWTPLTIRPSWWKCTLAHRRDGGGARIASVAGSSARFWIAGSWMGAGFLPKPLP
jgi:hypothetical protein